MKKIFFILTILTITSCKKSPKEIQDTDYLKRFGQTDKVKISVKDKTALIEFDYDSELSIGSENAASIFAIMYFDSTQYNIVDKFSRIKVHIGFKDYVDTFLYEINNIKEYKLALDKCHLFVNNMMVGNSLNNKGIVDTNKIQVQNLTDLNSVGTQLNQLYKIESFVNEGFRINPDNANLMEISGVLQNSDEFLRMNFQYDLYTKKIYYFGIND